MEMEKIRDLYLMGKLGLGDLMGKPEIGALLDRIEFCLEKPGCDGTFQYTREYTREWAIDRGVDPEVVVRYVKTLENKYCYWDCDCEVLFNVRYGSDNEPEPDLNRCELFGMRD